MVRIVAHQLRWPILAAVAVCVGSTLGYMAIEGFNFDDALFMAVITLSTVGYSEVHPLDQAGRFFTIAVIVAGFVTVVAAAAVLTNMFTSGDASRHLRRAKGRRMRDALTDHVIVVGFGRVGQAAARSVRGLGQACLVLERNAGREEAIAAAGCVALIGDATVEADLEQAGIGRARALICAAEDDSINLVVTLTARAMRADLRIVSRVNETDWQDRIERAGANLARSPYPSYGLSLAASAITPSVIELLHLPMLGLAIEELQIAPGTGPVGVTLAELNASHHGVFIVGMRRGEAFTNWHDVTGAIEPGDVIVAVGSPDAVGLLAEEVQRESAPQSR